MSKLEEARQSYRLTFNTEAGERVLRDLKTYCSYNASTFVPGDPYETVLREGMRNVFLRILYMLEEESHEEKQEVAEDYEPME